MPINSFNLTTDPWIKVIETETGQLKTVSLVDLFTNAQDYRQLAGEMRAQNLAIMRLLLAILHTVYSRVDADGEEYSWLTVDDRLHIVESEDEDFDASEFMQTVEQLFNNGNFGTPVVEYLRKNAEDFDFFGEHPFYQATQSQYDSLVPAKKRVSTGAGTVAVKQINRLISESANTPALFAPKTIQTKNDVDLPQFVRWLITYQNFTGVTDKSKVEQKDKFSTPAGWVYRMNPVYAQGQNIFETLMLNLVLINRNESQDEQYYAERPVWEFPDIVQYVEERKTLALPDNLAFLYTALSRLIHVEWDAYGQPTIFSAGIPMFENLGALIEPMTVWRYDKKADPPTFKPALKSLQSLGTAMWRNFGAYINAYKNETDSREPGLVQWLHELRNEGIIPGNQLLTLATVNLISDGNATSQAPAAELADTMTVDADVLFADGELRWPERIAAQIELTKQVGSYYWGFIKDMQKIRNIGSDGFVNRESAKYYDHLNEPFKDWLAGLRNDDDRDQKEVEWKQLLQKVVYRCADDFMRTQSARDIKGVTIEDKNGVEQTINVFTAYNALLGKTNRLLNLKKG